ncbi:hypothetical protein [Amycolatopsis sp. NPDC003731]
MATRSASSGLPGSMPAGPVDAFGEGHGVRRVEAGEPGLQHDLAVEEVGLGGRAAPEALPGRIPAAPDRLAEVDGRHEVLRAEHGPGFLLEDPRRRGTQLAGQVERVEHVHLFPTSFPAFKRRMPGTTSTWIPRP